MKCKQQIIFTQKSNLTKSDFLVLEKRSDQISADCVSIVIGCYNAKYNCNRFVLEGLGTPTMLCTFVSADVIMSLYPECIDWRKRSYFITF
jgi:hypothetical protein